uniref:Uncharacterized protein n=1 Tax=Dulem virus 38 TaxID=3145756 RepID=A0AAU8B0C8_9CAUD
MPGAPKRRARRKLYEQIDSQYITDERALARAYREYSLTGVLEDPWTGDRYCPSCEKREDFCGCGECG